MSDTFQCDVDRIRAGTHAVVDLDAFSRNVTSILSIVGNDVALMAVVKADGYGHGAVECGSAAIDAGARMLGVARVNEAVYLRRAGLECPIVLIGPPPIAEIVQAIEHDITLTVGSQHSLDAVCAAAGEGRSAKVHVKVDTGMNRYGFSPDKVADAVEALASENNVYVEGVFTHFSSADELDPVPTDLQVERFWTSVASLDRRGLRPPFVHMANSAGILTGRVEGTNLVRSGIAMYGLSPSNEVPVDARFTPVMSVRSVVARRGKLRSGHGVSYGQTYVASHDEEIADVPVGYADGLPRRLRNQGWFVVDGQRAPIRGSVCMDQTVVGVSCDVREGDDVLVCGDGSQGEMTLDDVARMIGTVNYEIATRVMARVPRLYIRDGQPVAWESVLTGERGRIEA